MSAETIAVFATVTWLDVAAPVWFLLCWFGYTIWADRRPRRGLAATMHAYRQAWTQCMLRRENRMVDVMVIGHLMNSVAFFASTSLVVIGGLLAILGSRSEAMDLLRDLPFVVPSPPLLLEAKVLLLVVVFVYAFFKFTWAYRHYNYALILLGTVPEPGNLGDGDYHRVAERIAIVTTSTGRHFNRGVRAYYFGLAALSWFLHPWLLVALSFLVVLVMYRREFRSNLLRTLGDPASDSADA